jgi:hypothetical protein
MTRIALPQCRRSWIVAVPAGSDRPQLHRRLPSLLQRLEAESVGAVRVDESSGLSARVRAEFDAVEIQSADAMSALDEAPHAHLVFLPERRG